MSDFSTDPFFQVPVVSVSTSEGSVDVPAFYYEASNLTALFRVDPDAAAAMLAGTGLMPGLTLGGKAVVALAFYEYRHTSLGSYNEVGLAVAVVPEGVKLAVGGWVDLYRNITRRRLGFHVIDLPVTTSLADVGGREIWGYPKFVTDIGFRLAEGRFVGDVQGPGGGESILTLSGNLGLGIPVPPLGLVLYSQLGDQDLRTVVNVRGRASLHRGSGLHLDVGEADHQMVRNLVELGLSGQKPFTVMETHRFQSRLNSGEPLLLRQGA